METQTEIAKKDVFGIVTDRIIEHLEHGLVPWKQPWSQGGVPQNLVTKRPYRGINVWLLSTYGYGRNFFLTFKQVKELGGSVKRSEKSIPVIFWNWKEVKDEESEETRKVPFLRYYNVFNVDQCSDIDDHISHEPYSKVIDPIAECEKVIERMLGKPLIRHKEQKAFYNPLKDFINMPRMNAFESNLSYYTTLFHEIIHWTGHPTRLNRRELVQMEEFGSEPYSKEELTAEMGAAYLMSHCGYDDIVENSAAYIQGWLEKLKNDRRFVIYAAAKAQQAVDYILNIQTKQVEEVNEEQQASDLPF